MRNILGIFAILAILSSCGGSGGSGGELTGVEGRKKYFEPEPLGMVFIPQGSYNMGQSDQDVAWAQNSLSKTVTIDAFWMDETEITNNEYRQFVFWVRDSIMRRMLATQGVDGFGISEDALGNPIDPPYLNWETIIDDQDEEQNTILNEIYLTDQERFYHRKQVDTRKLNYEYYWYDLKQASQKANRYNFETKQYQGFVLNSRGEKVEITNRSSFLFQDVVNVYPDTLCWVADFTYSFNEPLTTNYFWHPAFDNYPVVGVSWRQATAFCNWRTQLLNNYLAGNGESFVNDYRLPSESEWEYGARGGLELAMYPWGGNYTRNNEGCFLANFKPLRGNYTDDGGSETMKVGSYEANEFGLYDMAGNVAEWTSSAFDESGYIFTHDLNPDYKYNALPDDPPVLKRKVIRGGSWKDIGYFLQVGVRSYEYQDTAKTYVGFRCVRSYLGGEK